MEPLRPWLETHGGDDLLIDPGRRAWVAEGIVSGRDVAYVEVVDRLVVDILSFAGIPRGAHVRGPCIEAVGHGWAGRKASDCRLLIDTEAFRDLEGLQRADSLLKTWLHESIHGRQRYAPGFAEEWRLYRGFEEGMVEGLARLIASELDLRPVLASYSFYVAAYRALAIELDVPLEELWRCLWRYPAGEVATGFIVGVEDVMAQFARGPLSQLQRARLFARARNLFGTPNSVQSPEEDMLLQAWREVLR